MSKLFRSEKKSSKKKAPVTSSPDCNQDEELLVPKAEFELPPNAAEHDAYWRASSDRIKRPREEKFPICRARKTGTHLPRLIFFSRRFRILPEFRTRSSSGFLGSEIVPTILRKATSAAYLVILSYKRGLSSGFLLVS
ncbi:hypothetical protein Rs2_15865 [Raphanus sativus]|nr:hypothetical protein Rs2_15865 [Raphanus sativus]